MAADQECYSPLHRPLTYPGMNPGTYTHTCPGCGLKFFYTVLAPQPKG